jgi:hypothetical protein
MRSTVYTFTHDVHGNNVTRSIWMRNSSNVMLIILRSMKLCKEARF